MERIARAGGPIGALLVVVYVCGCATAPPTPPPDPAIVCTSQLPKFSYSDEAGPVQKQGGITVELIPVAYELTRQLKVEDRPKPRPLFWVDDANEETVAWFDRVETPYYVPNPTNLRFAVKITNQMDGTLRLAGSIVTYQVDGRPLQVPVTNYAQFVNAIVPRRQTIECFIDGPPVDQLSSRGGQVYVSIDDVITERDDAGNPKKRSNFEWIFTYSMESVTRNDSVTVTPMVRTRPR